MILWLCCTHIPQSKVLFFVAGQILPSNLYIAILAKQAGLPHLMSL